MYACSHAHGCHNYYSWKFSPVLQILREANCKNSIVPSSGPISESNLGGGGGGGGGGPKGRRASV